MSGFTPAIKHVVAARENPESKIGESRLGGPIHSGPNLSRKSEARFPAQFIEFTRFLCPL